MIHELKIYPEHFRAVWRGEKTAELRVMDRPYAVGDVLMLQEFRPRAGEGYTGAFTYVSVTHIHTGLGLALGYGMLSFVRCAPPAL